MSGSGDIETLGVERMGSGEGERVFVWMTNSLAT